MKSSKLNKILTLLLASLVLSSCTRSSPEKISDSGDSSIPSDNRTEAPEGDEVTTFPMPSGSSSTASISSSSSSSSVVAEQIDASAIESQEIEQSLSDYSAEGPEIRDQEILQERNKGFISVRLDDETLLVAGGIGYGCGAKDREVKTAEIFNEKTKEREEISKLKTARAFASAVKLQDGRILVTGGTYCRHNGVFGWIQYSMNSAEIYNPENRSFEKVSDMKQDRSSHFSILLKDGRVIILGGRRNTNSSQTAEIFDPKTEDFVEMKAPQAWDIRAAQILNDGRILLLDSEGVKIFDLETGETKIIEKLGENAKNWVNEHAYLPQF